MNAHRARKRFGQNFLVNDAYIQQIVGAIAPQENEHIIEVGPGKGALTKALLPHCAHYTAIEIDNDLILDLLALKDDYPQFELIHQDVLQADFENIIANKPGRPARIIGNLPYNIATALIIQLLTLGQTVLDMVFMVQLEVAERLTAEQGSKHYGRLSLLCQYYCDSELLFTVPKEAFSPAPKVTSAIIQLRPKSPPADDIDTQLLQDVIRQAFSMRRKTIKNNLKSLLSADALTALSIDPGLRPEALSLQDYLKICKTLQK